MTGEVGREKGESSGSCDVSKLEAGMGESVERRDGSTLTVGVNGQQPAR